MTKKITYIDTEEEHFKILFELGIIDDLEDWELFQKQEEYFDKNLYDEEENDNE